MMPEATPWDDIAVPDTDFNVRQVEGQRVVPCNWGRNSDGECLFLIDLQGDHTTQFRRNVTTVKGIGVDLRSAGPDLQRLVLTLERHVDRDLFAGLCRTLGASLKDLALPHFHGHCYAADAAVWNVAAFCSGVR
ncbi:hypothetical protein RQ831_22280 [Roseomonas gilardii]|uniref:Uncharacterized protein n=1 Tax=Roseomonas gilardii TaxID=257708 RepID=A0ABU3ML89_9PROT|nr:hypothetical protein [Roseomonas gilardii]